MATLTVSAFVLKFTTLRVDTTVLVEAGAVYNDVAVAALGADCPSTL
jgi:hypothetical protein